MMGISDMLGEIQSIVYAEMSAQLKWIKRFCLSMGNKIIYDAAMCNFILGYWDVSTQTFSQRGTSDFMQQSQHDFNCKNGGCNKNMALLDSGI